MDDRNGTDEDLETKITYDWSPPTGQAQDFFYKGSSITREQVKSWNTRDCTVKKKNKQAESVSPIRSRKCLTVLKLENVEDIKKKYTQWRGIQTAED
jgi:hypothetical protein